MIVTFEIRTNDISLLIRKSRSMELTPISTIDGGPVYVNFWGRDILHSRPSDEIEIEYIWNGDLDGDFGIIKDLLNRRLRSIDRNLIESIRVRNSNTAWFRKGDEIK